MDNLKASELYTCSVWMYRSSQYSSLEEAIEERAIRIFEETIGYTSIISCLINCKKTAELLDYGSSRKDIRANICINGKWVKECFLAEAEETINSLINLHQTN